MELFAGTCSIGKAFGARGHEVLSIDWDDQFVWFIENPRGGMRKMRFMEGMPRYTVTYCQYGDKRMKPTDIWTNHPDPQFKPPCRNGAPCHESAPRSSTVRKMKAAGMDVSHIGGTQYGLDSSVERSRIPAQLCEHIVDICEKGLS